jgi:hypothetical protein
MIKRIRRWYAKGLRRIAVDYNNSVQEYLGECTVYPQLMGTLEYQRVMLKLEFAKMFIEIAKVIGGEDEN